MHIGASDIDVRLYPVSRTDQPAVALADMKKSLNVDFADDDALIGAMTTAATDQIDGPFGVLLRSIVDQTWDMSLSGFGCEPIQIPLPPLIEVESIKYFDGANVQQVVDAGDYEVVGAGSAGRRAFVRPSSGKSWPAVYGRSEPITIRFRAGFMDMTESPPASRIPAAIQAAIKLMVGAMYANRENVVIGDTAVEIPWGAAAMLQPYRVFA